MHLVVFFIHIDYEPYFRIVKEVSPGGIPDGE